MSEKALLIITDGTKIEAVRVIPVGTYLRNIKPRTKIENGKVIITQFVRTDVPFIVDKNEFDEAKVIATGTKSSDMAAAIQQLVAEAKLNK